MTNIMCSWRQKVRFFRPANVFRIPRVISCDTDVRSSLPPGTYRPGSIISILWCDFSYFIV